jgi:hypothetical protein
VFFCFEGEEFLFARDDDLVGRLVESWLQGFEKTKDLQSRISRLRLRLRS